MSETEYTQLKWNATEYRRKWTKHLLRTNDMCVLKVVHGYIPMDRNNQVNQEKDGESNIHKGERSMKWSLPLVLPSAVFSKQIQTFGPGLVSPKFTYIEESEKLAGGRLGPTSWTSSR